MAEVVSGASGGDRRRRSARSHRQRRYGRSSWRHRSAASRSLAPRRRHERRIDAASGPGDDALRRAGLGSGPRAGSVDGGRRRSRPRLPRPRLRRRHAGGPRQMAELTLGYKASAEQFGPQELVDLSVQAEELGLDLIARLRPLPALAPHGRTQPGRPALAGGAHAAHQPRVAGNLGADADDALPPVGGRPGVRHRSRAWHRDVSFSASARGRR